ncbi:MAG: alpha/beta hydrolase [Mesorhizobium sp.]|nr:alpha/beta hydrolase [bacterium M00.F.Ca.ET.205.01.1.1]TGU53806.1 alpha/beta hydrolase [bacterium M00.F.Ca.ET.152.01.1.1]TGV37304.1 alpha/beta hydrolase [Mesorhizobium sp. M00.F.Ca.ET.186.01.1.1]TGZ41336.1 alpha/beta hydrolase [bacterium M00.F.Ca.ET.162.01.1.1]TIW61438.1 MAG: alpha/beta hydrolase [Mesorhizobium sp.]
MAIRSLSPLHALLAATFVLCVAGHANALELKPFKDDLFAYPATLSSDSNGAYTVIDYREMRDINQRDEVPEKRVHAQYTDTGVRKVQQDLLLKTDVGDVRHIAVGKTQGAGIIVLYLHGQGGSRKQGVDDFTFGGNFNRLKNLMAGNGGLYLSPDFTDFGDKGAAQVAALIDHYAEQSPTAKIFVACGSMGGALCWKLAARNDTGRRLDGLLLLGSLWDDSFLASPAFRRHVPVFFGQGSHDVVFPVADQEAFFRSIIAKSKAYPYPTHFVRFETGTHGTPIRMVDWRGTLNWMLSKAP